MKILFPLSALFFSLPFVPVQAFVSKKATEARLFFSFEVQIEQSRRPTSSEAKAQVEFQVRHMFGPMERANVMAAPKEDELIQVESSKIEPVEGRNGVWRIPYSYEGTIVIENGPRIHYRFPLPVNPQNIYEKSKTRAKINPCTDEHYQSEGDFWYFWSPAGWGRNDYPKCKLRSNENGRIEEDEDYEIVDARIERFAKDRTTYPEYDRLAENGTIDLHLFYGKDEPSGSNNPYKSNDVSAGIYKDSVKALQALGFQFRRWSREEINVIVPTDQPRSVVYVEEGTKTYPNGMIAKARVFFGQIGIDEKSAGFHYFFRDSLKSSSILIYNGHSGLGTHLDLHAIAQAHHFRLQPNKNRYQIYFFNSCTSYTYYNTLYFSRKRGRGAQEDIDAKGTHNLDILANGLSTSFDVMHDTDIALVKAVDRYVEHGEWLSYQRLARQIDSDNLFTVNGDEDNPTSPR